MCACGAGLVNAYESEAQSLLSKALSSICGCFCYSIGELSIYLRMGAEWFLQTSVFIGIDEFIIFKIL